MISATNSLIASKGDRLLVSIGSSLLANLANLATVIDEGQHALCLFLHIDSLVFAIGLDMLKVQQCLQWTGFSSCNIRRQVRSDLKQLVVTWIW